MRMYLTDGSYWQTLVKPTPAPTAISIGPYTFQQQDGKLVQVDPATIDVGQLYQGPVSYMGEDLSAEEGAGG